MDNTVLSASEIFRRAKDITDQHERQRFLDSSCGDDAALRAELSHRLEKYFLRGDTLEETTDGQGQPVRVEGVPRTGSRIGPYLLLEEIGEGGMGVVFLAQQVEPVRRRVALKVIKVGMDTRRVVARFEAEQQTMALLDHPCITKVLDAGATDSGRPYFVMELVQGLPITKYCDENQLSIARRLEIFVQVCNALEHAHQKGVIHRDIKPTNIMVAEQDGVPLPKIIDFGIAKATSEHDVLQSAVTRQGEMVGTPLYMSPEQSDSSEADIDTRSDIYSLGVLLYELLTGTTPFFDLKKKSIDDIRAAIRLQDPPTASSRVNSLRDTVIEISRNRGTDAKALYRSIRGELDWILAKCLARDRNQRYQSAGELAREIHRYMRGEALEAAAPTFGYRTQKFVKKHRVAVATTAFIAFLLTFVSIFSSWMAVNAQASAARATNAEKLANSRLSEVIVQRDRAIAAEKRLAQLEREQRNLVAIHQATAMHNAKAMKKLMDRAGDGNLLDKPSDVHLVPLASLLEVPPPQPPQPAVPEMGKSLPREFASDSAKAEALRSAVIVSSPEDVEDLHVLVCEEEGECREEVLKTILAQQRFAFGEKDIVVARTLNQLGEIMLDERNWKESEEYFNQAVDILKDVAEDNPEIKQIRNNLSRALQSRGDVQQAIVELQAAQQTIREMDLKKNLYQVWDRVKEGLEASEKEKQQKKD